MTEYMPSKQYVYMYISTSDIHKESSPEFNPQQNIIYIYMHLSVDAWVCTRINQGHLSQERIPFADMKGCARNGEQAHMEHDRALHSCIRLRPPRHSTLRTDPQQTLTAYC